MLQSLSSQFQTEDGLFLFWNCSKILVFSHLRSEKVQGSIGSYVKAGICSLTHFRIILKIYEVFSHL